MKNNKFSTALAKKAESMLADGKIPYSSLPRWFYDNLQSEGLITSISRGSHKTAIVTDVEKCRLYIEQTYTNGTCLPRWIETVGNAEGDVERAALVNETGSSKTIKTRSFKGFLAKCCEPITASLCGNTVTLSPTKGMALFIQDTDTFSLPADVVVIGMENGENFQHAERQRHLFDASQVLFVSRYPQSTDLRNWLINVPNRYIHFGDFDLAGISIYQSEFYKYLPDRASFFIPADIDERLKTGNSTLYDLQYSQFRHLQIADPRLTPLVEMIHRYHRVYEQEGYIAPSFGE